ncbi:MAG: GC-type dockerin domain-anchored protein [Phycisphaerales bacterium]
MGSTIELRATIATSYFNLTYRWQREEPRLPEPGSISQMAPAAARPAEELSPAHRAMSGKPIVLAIADAQMSDSGMPVRCREPVRLEGVGHRIASRSASVCQPDLTTSSIQAPRLRHPRRRSQRRRLLLLPPAVRSRQPIRGRPHEHRPARHPGYGVPNGILNNDDFFYYLTIFAAGC